MEDQLPPMAKAIQSHAQDIASLLNKVDDLENRSRRNNVRLVGVPEKAEGRNLVAFLESWLINAIGKDSLSPLKGPTESRRVPCLQVPLRALSCLNFSIFRTVILSYKRQETSETSRLPDRKFPSIRTSPQKSKRKDCNFSTL